jgi:hypothetical protein
MDEDAKDAIALIFLLAFVGFSAVYLISVLPKIAAYLMAFILCMMLVWSLKRVFNRFFK